MGIGISLNNKIDIALEYGVSLIGTPYGFYKGSMAGSPCYADIKPVPLYINECNCVGLINLIRKKLYLSIPYHDIFPGGVKAWTIFLNKKKGLLIFDINKQYPNGSLLISPNTDNFPGHIAILYKVNNLDLLNSKLLHSFPEYENFSYSSVGPGVCITTIRDCPMNGQYKYICPPNIWLTK